MYLSIKFCTFLLLAVDSLITFDSSACLALGISSLIILVVSYSMIKVSLFFIPDSDKVLRLSISICLGGNPFLIIIAYLLISKYNHPVIRLTEFIW